MILSRERTPAHPPFSSSPARERSSELVPTQPILIAKGPLVPAQPMASFGNVPISALPVMGGGSRVIARQVVFLTAMILCAAPPAFALAPLTRGEIIGQPFATKNRLFPTSPVPPSPAATSAAVSPTVSPAPPEPPVHTEAKSRGNAPRTNAPAWLDRLARKSQGARPDRSWLFLGGMALALAVCGGGTILARRFAPRAGSGAIQVVGRVSLSPKHTVYLLRVGDRVLLIGAGPQGAPALLGELDELPEPSPGSEEGGPA